MSIARVEKLREAVEVIAQRGIDPIGIMAWPIQAHVTIEDFRRVFSGRRASRESCRDSWRWTGTLYGFEWVAYENVARNEPVEMEVT